MTLRWIYFWLAQLITLLFTVIGWPLILIAAVCKAWEWNPDPSINADRHMIDRWRWHWMNPIWGNPEDGVSGKCARVWVNATTKDAYWPTVIEAGVPWPPAWLRCWVWSAWRNSTNQLKYELSLDLPPLTMEKRIGSRVLKGGWSTENGRSVLVLSFKAAS